MRYKLFYTSQAKKDLDRLDKQIAGRILDKIDFFLSTSQPLRFAKRLVDSCGAYRFRIGDYRAIFDLDDKGRVIILLILRIKHRKEVYV